MIFDLKAMDAAADAFIRADLMEVLRRRQTWLNRLKQLIKRGGQAMLKPKTGSHHIHSAVQGFKSLLLTLDKGIALHQAEKAELQKRQAQVEHELAHAHEVRKNVAQLIGHK